ncbi:hypothetical protein J6590_103022 [Homalodisca vitripennis]|nr:hypothetical protein J6590_103022 [Homalodisca vitripennis]
MLGAHCDRPGLFVEIHAIKSTPAHCGRNCRLIVHAIKSTPTNCGRPGQAFCVVRIHAIKWTPAHCGRPGTAREDSAHTAPEEPTEAGPVASIKVRPGLDWAGRSGRRA